MGYFNKFDNFDKKSLTLQQGSEEDKQPPAYAGGLMSC